MSSDITNLNAAAQKILNQNRRGRWTCPSPEYYRHQWLWDSAFMAIGIANYDAQRAATELLSLKRGQWQNGMLPHVIFTTRFHRLLNGPIFWQFNRPPLAPKGVVTSAITQPPMPAVAAFMVAKKLSTEQRQKFIAAMLPVLVKYHAWLYDDRDPDNTGLIVAIHPWETGLDNAPSWSEMLRRLPEPWWFKFLGQSGIYKLLMHWRRGASNLNPEERTSYMEVLQASRLILAYRKLKYNNKKILSKPIVAVESVTFNSILIKANACLKQMAELANYPLPQSLIENFKRTESAIELLWDEKSGQYYSRNFITKELIRSASVSNFLPLYAQTASPERAERLVKLLKDENKYWTSYPVPTVPLDSAYFSAQRFWQGPVWLNTNWFIIQGLQVYGYKDEARHLIERTEKMIQKSGFREYFSPLDGGGLGVDNFGWTAALFIDLQNYKS